MYSSRNGSVLAWTERQSNQSRAAPIPSVHRYCFTNNSFCANSQFVKLGFLRREKTLAQYRVGQSSGLYFEEYWRVRIDIGLIVGILRLMTTPNRPKCAEMEKVLPDFEHLRRLFEHHVVRED